MKLPDYHILLRLRYHFDDISMYYSHNITHFQSQHYVQLCTLPHERMLREITAVLTLLRQHLLNEFRYR